MIRSSVVGSEFQSDFVFMNAKGAFCMIAAETPSGMSGWLPCKWFIGGQIVKVVTAELLQSVIHYCWLEYPGLLGTSFVYLSSHTKKI